MIVSVALLTATTYVAYWHYDLAIDVFYKSQVLAGCKRFLDGIRWRIEGTPHMSSDGIHLGIRVRVPCCEGGVRSDWAFAPQSDGRLAHPHHSPNGVFGAWHANADFRLLLYVWSR